MEPNPIPEEILERLRLGDPNVVSDLLPFVYDHLRQLAGFYFQHQRPNHTLQPTALVHEAFVRLAGGSNLAWKDRGHFVATCALAMRQILAENARRRRASKRGDGWQRVTLAGIAQRNESDEQQVDLIVLDDLLSELASLSPRQSKIAELRLFGALSIDAIATELGQSSSTIEKDWRMARAWLSLRMSSDPER